MSAVFSPFQLGQLALGNRIVIAPMCQYSIKGDAQRLAPSPFGRPGRMGSSIQVRQQTGQPI